MNGSVLQWVLYTLVELFGLVGVSLIIALGMHHLTMYQGRRVFPGAFIVTSFVAGMLCLFLRDFERSVLFFSCTAVTLNIGRPNPHAF